MILLLLPPSLISVIVNTSTMIENSTMEIEFNYANISVGLQYEPPLIENSMDPNGILIDLWRIISNYMNMKDN